MTFKDATDLLSVSLEEVAQALGRSYRTVVAYRRGERRVPEDVRRELAAFMRRQSSSLESAAEELEEQR